MEALADMLDRALMQADGGNSEAGKEIVRQITTEARNQLGQIKCAKNIKQALHPGATHDNR